MPHEFALHVRNAVDHEGNPAGGSVRGIGISIAWQDGPLRSPTNAGVDATARRNGAFVEDAIDAAVTRLEFYQSTRFACDENALAITHLKAARQKLEQRTVARETRGVEGTHEV